MYGNGVGLTGLLGDPLGGDLLALLLGFTLEGVVLADALGESFSAQRLAEVLNTDVEPLGDNAGVNTLVDDNTDGVAVHIEDAAGLSVVELVGHTSLDFTISDDVDNVALLVDGHHLGEGRLTVLLEGYREEIASTGSETEGVGHLSLKLSKYLITKHTPY